MSFDFDVNLILDEKKFSVYGHGTVQPLADLRNLSDADSAASTS